jgi:hypothetical protein
MIMNHLMQRIRFLLRKLGRDKLINVYFSSKMINKIDKSVYHTFNSSKNTVRYSYINKALVVAMMDQIDAAIQGIECTSNLIECFSMEIIFIKNLTPKPFPQHLKKYSKDEEEC